eukprot:Gregarina_sp_Poly_1__422@NODE_1101_length_5098_cov_110_751342_g763_i0_p3_GENE_NODE_1101_length_5098_cov_110_751342_g763_i0NODE_1101_length_5098_cov_110_751342_g763_i0_p3_ORF_typecomplete_len406_score38_58Hexokinase_1/PF00349_21/6_9e31Hexokinase_2/PF03727_16/4_3e30_NODE_1101_length_5098_cov_110_751342_g763_i03841601
MLDSFITRLPTGTEAGIAYGLDFCNTNIRAVWAKLEGNGSMLWKEETLNLLQEPANYPRGLLDRECSAMELFDSVARIMCKCLNKYKTPETTPCIGFTMAFPLELQGQRSASLGTWSKGFETGRATDDPAEGLDVVTMLEMAMWRQQMPCRVEGVANDTVALLLAGAYEKPARLPPCAAALVMGVGFNGSYVEPNADYYKYRGCVINCELGRYDKAYLATDIDREILFHECDLKDSTSLELIAGGGCLGEICRRLILRIWRGESPTTAWMQRSLPTLAAMLCVTDTTNDLTNIGRLMTVLWDWSPSLEDRKMVQLLFSLVFERAAAVGAAAIASLARKSGRLHPHVGGLTIALDGAPHVQHSWFQAQLNKYLRSLLGPEYSRLVHVWVVQNGTQKGAALLGLPDT